VSGAAALALALAPATASAQTAADWRAAAQRAAEPLPPRDPSRGFMVRAELGASLRSLYGVAVYGGDLRVDFGWRTARWFAGGGPEFHFGRTTHGLDTFLVGLRGSVGAIVGRFTLGGGLEWAWLQIDRITRRETLYKFALGPRAFVGVDLLRWDQHALTLTVDVGVLLHAQGYLPSGALLLGFRR